MNKKLGTKTKLKKHPPVHPLKHHDVPPHVFHSILGMKEEIGKLKGKIEIIEKILITKGSDIK